MWRPSFVITPITPAECFLGAFCGARIVSLAPSFQLQCNDGIIVHMHMHTYGHGQPLCRQAHSLSTMLTRPVPCVEGCPLSPIFAAAARLSGRPLRRYAIDEVSG